jgi:hypothetical protein
MILSNQIQVLEENQNKKSQRLDSYNVKMNGLLKLKQKIAEFLEMFKILKKLLKSIKCTIACTTIRTLFKRKDQAQLH